MNKATIKELPLIEQIVRSGQDLAGVQAPDGNFVPREALGPGVIREVGHETFDSPKSKLCEDKETLVHWVAADFDAWMQPDEIERLDPEARLIAVYERFGHAGRTFKRYKVVSRAGLTHNWLVELLPKYVVRTVRSDGPAWTFDWYPVLERAFPIRTLEQNPPTDDDAEALTVAELALSQEVVP